MQTFIYTYKVSDNNNLITSCIHELTQYKKSEERSYCEISMQEVFRVFCLHHRLYINDG